MLCTSWDDESNCTGERRKQVMKVAFHRNGMKYYPLDPRGKYATIKTIAFIESRIKRQITTRDDRALFKKVVKLLKRDINTSLYGYVDAIVVYSTTEVDSAEEEFDLEDEPPKDMYQSGIFATRP